MTFDRKAYQAEYRKKWKEANPGYNHAYHLAHKGDSHSKQLRVEAKIRYDERHPEKVHAKNKRRYQRLKSDPIRNARRLENMRRYNSSPSAKKFRASPEGRAQAHAINGRYREKKRQQLFNIFGDHCRCCGESDKVFLTLNHINGDGAEERRRLTGNPQGGSMASWREAIRTRDRARYEILCYNCNNAVKDGCICPHQLSKQQE